MSVNQTSTSYSRPTQNAVQTQGCAIVWITVFLFGFAIAAFLFIMATLSRDIGGVCVSGCVGSGFLLFLSWFVYEFKLAKELDRVGVTTSGKVVELWEEVSRGKNGPVRSYYFAYHFTVSGQTFGVRQKINLGQYDTLQVNDTVIIRYVPTDPTKSRAEL